MEPVEVHGQSVVDGVLPVDPWQRRSLRVRDGDDGHVAEFPIQRRQVWYVEAAVKCSHGRDRQTRADREVQIVDVKVDDIEFLGVAEHELQHANMMGQLIHAVLAQTEEMLGRGDQPGASNGITTGEQGYVMSLTNQLFRQVRDNPLGSTVILGRDTFIERRNLRDLHGIDPCKQNTNRAATVMARSLEWPVQSRSVKKSQDRAITVAAQKASNHGALKVARSPSSDSARACAAGRTRSPPRPGPRDAAERA